jgi:8-oxo-dGTP pyrophosphatase MutT (NUDIX family)
VPPASDAGPPVRDAATIILVRRTAGAPQVLMGQRGGGAAFMPDKFVFPGGAVDPEDAALPGPVRLAPETARRLAVGTPAALVPAIARAAVRELWEETGLLLGRPEAGAAAETVPAAWQGFFAAGLEPHTAALRFVFRAVTPPGRPRRFDARFFLAEAAELAGAAHDDFAGAGEELSHLRWLDLGEARTLPLPFITEVVLAELGEILADPDPDRPVPFFDQTPEGARFRML